MPLYSIGFRVQIGVYGVFGAAVIWPVRIAGGAAVFIGLCGR